MSRRSRSRGRSTSSSPEEALTLFDERYEEGDLDGALEVAEGALEANPDHAALHHARGLALWGSGRSEDGAHAIQQSLELDRSVPEPALDLASILIDQLGCPQDALDVLHAARRAFREPEMKAGMHRLRARALLDLEDAASAEAEIRKARKHAPDDPDLVADLGEMRMEVLDFRRAAEALEEALGLDAENPRTHWLRGVLRDRQDDPSAMADFEAATALDPKTYFVPERIDEEEFDRQVERAIRQIPPRFRKHLANVEVAVEPYPSVELLGNENLSPLILGLFVGTPLTDRSFDQSDMPPRILIFQRNLENVCRTRRELVREIGITVRHEIGHLLGMEEEEIEDAGHA